MKAIILAAGKGSRLGALGEAQPKCMLPLGNKLILDHQCDSLIDAGVSDIIIVGGYKIEEIRRYLDGEFTVIENSEYATTNTSYSCWLAREAVGDDAFICFNGDVLYDPTLIDRFVNHPAETANLVDELRPFNTNEYHVSVHDGRIVRQSNDIESGESAGEDGQAFKVAKKDAPAFWRKLESVVLSDRSGYVCVGFPALIERGNFHPIFVNGALWFEIDSMEDYLNALRAFRSQAKRRSFKHVINTEKKRDQRFLLVRIPIIGPVYEFTKWFIHKIRYYTKRKELPWRMRWVPIYFAGLIRHPVRAFKLLPKLSTMKLSCCGFNLQVYGKQFLKDVMSECAELGLRPFLEWGTLLGCIRERSFIMNDHDIDMGMLAADFAQKDKLRDALVAKGFKVRIDDPYKLSILHPTVDSLFVDIDLVYKKNDHMVISCSHPDEANLFSYYFNKDLFGTLKTTRFLGVDVFIPEDGEGFLEVVYGDWRTPQSKSHYLYGPLNLRIEEK